MAPTQHSLSAIFPALQADDMAALVEDIRTNGLRNAIVLLDGQVLDGWNRYQACLKAHVKPIYTTYGGKDAAQYVRSQNWHRRHMTASQRASVEVKLSDWLSIGEKSGSPSNEGLRTTAKMAADAGVGVATIERAKIVEATGSTALKEAVKDGGITVDRAAKIAKLPKKEQAKAMKATPPKHEPQPHPAEKAYAELKEKYDELVEELETRTSIEGGEVEKDMKNLRESLRLVTRRRDELMVQVKEIRAQCDYWRKCAEKAEREAS